jgi:hypothetical protein
MPLVPRCAFKAIVLVLLLVSILQQFFRNGLNVFQAPEMEIRQYDLQEPLELEITSNNETGFGACLLIKQDNDLLYEWLAYHVMVLPLKYVVVGSDLGNTEDPALVLERYRSVGLLDYQVLNASVFSDRHGVYRGNYSEKALQAGRELVHRQNGFITTCIDTLKEKGIGWTIFSDTDEFLVLNRLLEDEINSLKTKHGRRSQPMSNISFHIRRNLPTVESDATLLDVITQIQKSGHQIGPCYTIPRLLFGALENVTCPNAQSVVDLAKRSFRFESISTLRFVQHAKKGEFDFNRWAKVIIDVSQLSNETTAIQPKNIHRPFSEYCSPPFVNTYDSYFLLNHYVQSWERYSARQDDRRNRQEWEKRSHMTSGTSCDQAIHRWFPRFIQRVGSRRAKFLLGVEE